MADVVELKARPREVRGKKVKGLRREGWIPAVVYGKDVPSTPIQIAARELDRLLARKALGGTLRLVIEGEEAASYLVKVQELQRDPVKRKPIHLDFLVVEG